MSNKKIEIVPYNEEWPLLFEQESQLIQDTLGDNLLSIYHIGSTSVPGLSAKPKIDIIAVIKNRMKAIEQLKSIDYKYMGEYNMPLHDGFAKRGNIDVNLHMYEEGHPDIELNLLFRDWLRNNPEDRDEYAQLKTDLLKDESAHIKKEGSAFPNYTLRKGSFIHDILKKAGFNRLRISLLREDEKEYLAAERYRDQYYSKRGMKAPPFRLNDESSKHILLYKGVDIIGYLHIVLFDQDKTSYIGTIEIDNDITDKESNEFFDQLEKWLKKIGYPNIIVLPYLEETAEK